MRVEQPAGALYAEAAWGNPEIGVAYSRPWLEREGWRLDFVGGLAVGVPLAERDGAQLARRALVLANALEGFSEPGLFTPGVLPLTPSVGLRWESRRWLLSASVRVPLLFRVSEADLPAETDTRPLGISPVARVDARLRVRPWLSLAAGTRLTLRAVSPVDDHGGAAQLLGGGRAEFHLLESLTLSVVFQSPLGGSLGGTTVAGA